MGQNPLRDNETHPSGFVVRVDESQMRRYLFRDAEGHPVLTGDAAVVEQAAREQGLSLAHIQYVPEPTTWPQSILPALLRRAAVIDRAKLLAVHPRIVEGLRELAAVEPSGRVGRLVEACERWGGESIPAADVLDCLWWGEPPTYVVVWPPSGFDWVDWGDGEDSEVTSALVDEHGTGRLGHMYVAAGRYTLQFWEGGAVVQEQQVTVHEPGIVVTVVEPDAVVGPDGESPDAAGPGDD